MSANCIQTKLIGSAENNNLPRLGRLMLEAVAAGENEIGIGGRGIVINVIDGTLKWKSSGNVVSTPLSMNQDYATSFVFVANSVDSKVTIDNKYGVSHLNGKFNLADVSYCTEITELSTGNNGPWFYGNISALKNLTNLTKFFPAQDKDIYGDIKVLGNMSNLNQIGIRGTTQITGTVESVIQTLIANGRTSAVKETGIAWASLIQQELVTFNGVKPSTNGYFIWSAGETAGQYVITYKASSDDSTISSVTVTVE